MTTESGQTEDWWSVFHVPEMADLFLVRSDPDELQATLAFLIDELALHPGVHVYDQCCGIGSLTIALQQAGFRAVGADLCRFFIERGIDDAATAGADCPLHCADAFEFVPEWTCDGVFNWYSSFGYADTDALNQKMLLRAFETLRPGGRFALDVPNLPGVLRGFQRHLVRHGESAGRAVTLVRASEINLQRGLLEQTWTWLIEGRPPVERRSALRLYLPHQIRELMEQSGFTDVRFFGSIDRDTLKLDSPRLICVAERPT